MSNKVVILTDSTADLSKDLLKQYDVQSIPLYVRFGEDVYKDGIDITTPELYQKVDSSGELPKTAAASPGDFIDVFEKNIQKGFDIVFIGIGSKLSATMQSAHIAKMEFPEGRIFLVDSANLSSGIALLVLKAKDMRGQGMSAEGMAFALNALVPKVRSQFAIKTLDYLHKGGRASGTAKLIGGILGIKPIIQVRDGKLTVYKKPAGKMSRALDIMLDDYVSEGDNLDLDYVMITHSSADKQAVYMMEQVKEKTRPNAIIESHAGCVISSHCGAGTIGILYLVKS
ncbi:MAG: DegV family protein [Acholeplasmataceae bacterium]|nr:DegV family protein [Acholeplasmataceae bacterium]